MTMVPYTRDVRRRWLNLKSSPTMQKQIFNPAGGKELEPTYRYAGLNCLDFFKTKHSTRKFTANFW